MKNNEGTKEHTFDSSSAKAHSESTRNGYDSFFLMNIPFTCVPLYYIKDIVREIGLQSSLNQMKACNTAVMHELHNEQVSKGNHTDIHVMTYHKFSICEWVAVV